MPIDSIQAMASRIRRCGPVNSPSLGGAASCGAECAGCLVFCAERAGLCVPRQVFICPISDPLLAPLENFGQFAKKQLPGLSVVLCLLALLLLLLERLFQRFFNRHLSIVHGFPVVADERQLLLFPAPFLFPFLMLRVGGGDVQNSAFNLGSEIGSILEKRPGLLHSIFAYLECLGGSLARKIWTIRPCLCPPTFCLPRFANLLQHGHCPRRHNRA